MLSQRDSLPSAPTSFDNEFHCCPYLLFNEFLHIAELLPRAFYFRRRLYARIMRESFNLFKQKRPFASYRQQSHGQSQSFPRNSRIKKKHIFAQDPSPLVFFAVALSMGLSMGLGWTGPAWEGGGEEGRYVDPREDVCSCGELNISGILIMERENSC
jgi:hypothetical protein